ncbi:MAG: non-ribosomal peptide synthetase [Pedosphaera sp.]|nr:non-ribosomal peptide synthetase [Pedosphaera sp.]
MSTKITPLNDSAQDLRTRLADRLLEATGRAQTIPLSCAQQRLWFLVRLEPNSPLYNIPCVTRLTGALDIAALNQALNAILARHEILRARIVIRNAEPTQAFDGEANLQIQFEDLADHPASDRGSEMKRWALAEAKRPFNLDEGRLLRATLLWLRPEEHVLILNMHHIISDEWLLKVLFRELGEFYASFVQGTPAPLPDLPIQYGDFAVWQREWLEGHGFEKQLCFWKEQLSGRPSAIDLPTDRPRQSSRGSSHGAVQVLPLCGGLSASFHKFANVFSGG